MNDRWSELAEECWDERIDGYHFDQEMFAELIIKECIEWCDAHATINGTAQQVRDSIKQHFGIEE
jgi:hypothetical protein